MQIPRLALTPALAIGLLLLTGCASFVAEKVAFAPNADRADDDIRANRYPPDVRDIVVDRDLRLPVAGSYGAGPAELSVWIIDANDQALEPSADGLGFVLAHPDKPRQTIEPRGTVVLLHGFKHRKTKRVYLEWARLLATSGYRCVLIDNRGHGDSTGKLVGFGVREADDTAQVLDALEQQGQLVKPLVLLGGSLGAATAIQLAATDDRIDTVIAVAPYARLDEVMESFAEAYTGFARLVPEDTWTRYAEAVCKLAGITLEQTNNIRAAREVKVPVLLIAGESDERVPIKQVRAVLNAAPQGSKLVTVPGESHNSLGKGVIAPVRDAVLEWLEKPATR
ncbi:MAG: alpha/beta hydrolase family protein [Phycisphaeraceae bacterium]